MKFRVTCPYCLLPLDVFKTRDPDDWHEALAWGYLAAAKHKGSCPARAKAPVD